MGRVEESWRVDFEDRCRKLHGRARVRMGFGLTPRENLAACRSRFDAYLVARWFASLSGSGQP